ncbi:MAG: hypothetical protein OXG64_00540 [Chloroflexi bacterium]|nr:hypothetical protein [Chloroflexota bacterium]
MENSTELRRSESERFRDLLQQVQYDDQARNNRLSVDDVMSLLAHQEDLDAILGAMIANELRD